ncbi:MAG TPA: twin-arginine translocase subunit TatC [Dehalococcoidia bacterium]|nr:twin-arginine translocase subunit TatC [Dehalococcoidia bacterium]
MTILEHLIELRNRVVVSAVAVVICTVITLVFAERIIDFLLEPAKESIDEEDFTLIFTKPFGYVGSYFRVGLTGGVALAMPILVYEALMYVSPALTKEEKRWVFPTVLGAAAAFLGGAAFAYYIVMPPSMDFLLNFGEGTAEPFLEIGPYIDFVTRLLLAVGLSFETPLIIMFLARIGLVSARKLLGWWRYAIVLAFVVSAVITPTIDPVTQLFVAGPIIVLYGLGIVLAAIFGRTREVLQPR